MPLWEMPEDPTMMPPREMLEDPHLDAAVGDARGSHHDANMGDAGGSPPRRQAPALKPNLPPGGLRAGRDP